MKTACFWMMAVSVLVSQVNGQEFAPGGRVAPSRGVRQCSSCHPAQAKAHPFTSMAHALETVTECDILRRHPVLTFQSGEYSYRIERKGDQSLYSVTDGKQTLTTPIAWAFGLGDAGQTYVIQKNGALYESRVSYYRALGMLDWTMGAQYAKPGTIQEAFGRLIDARGSQQCFGCHTTNSVVASRLSLNTFTPGVQCERCHGDTAQHLAGLKSGNPKLPVMKKLASMSTEDTSNFCGQCHRTWEEIAMNGPHGTGNVRFQPYRLTKSKCYDTEDKRISCVACHDPHKELDRNDLSYDAKCQDCHGGGKRAAKACKVSAKGCVSCHMPKVELPGAHHRFTDHDIRIARADGTYPD